MESYVLEWLALLGRWAHVIAAIAWIGHAFLFHSFEHGLHPPKRSGDENDAAPDVHGEMWMVHGGGFFRLQKTRALPPVYTGPLKWFKWEAAATWLSGVFLLVIVFYLNGRGMMVDTRVADLSPAAAIAIAIGSLVAGWALYDLIWVALGRSRPAIGAALTAALFAAAAIALTQLLPGRAAYLHVGAMMGTIMAANVWMRILPNTRRMTAALESGEEPDLSRGEIGRQRSLHNGYMHFPVIFIMISNHFPGLYGHEYNALILIALIVLGAGLRQVLYEGRTHPAVYAALAIAAGAVIWMTAPRPEPDEPGDGPVVTTTDGGAGAPTAAKPIPADEVGTIRGVVALDGVPPAPATLDLAGNCVGIHPGPVYDDAVLVRDGALQNAFVWIRDGWQGWQIPPAPDTEVEIDQQGCLYTPRVVGARVRQPVTFVNSDPFLHNVRGVADKNRSFNISMPAPGDRRTHVYKKPEVMVEARCDVHPWMHAFVGVVPHPWFAVTDADGAFSLEGVPPGEYTVEAWHEKYGTITGTATVSPSGTAELTLTFKG